MSSLERHPDYDGNPLDPSTVDADPFAQFARWLADADDSGTPEPNAMVLGTVDADGTPSARTVLLKGLSSPEGPAFEFVTNGRSRKGRALAADARVSLVFPWYALQRQVLVEGRARPAPAEISDAYWSTRPRGSQLGAWASDQSEPVESRTVVEQRMTDAEARFPGQVPRPEHWGAWFVDPVMIEFWQGRPSRLHDRVAYLSDAGAEGGWRRLRRQP